MAKIMVCAFLVFFVLVWHSPSKRAQEKATYDEVVTGRRCFKNQSGDLECDYRVGRSLHFGIVGVGKPDGSLYFYSASFEGDYFAVVGLSHGCVVVRPGKALTPERVADLTFVSPRNGKVYQTWEECGEK